MTTRSILIEQVRRRLAGGEVPNNFPITVRDVGKMVDQVSNGVIEIKCKQGFQDDYVTTFENVPIAYDQAKCLYYSQLTGKAISLSSQGGIYQVSTMTDQAKTFIGCPVNAQFLYPNLADLLGDDAGYYNQQFKIWYVNYIPTEQTDTILLKMIIDRSVFEDDEDYQIPAGEVENLIIDLVFNKFQAK